jgi:hypothetical protein
MIGEEERWRQQVTATLAELEQRVAQVEAQLQALDESYVRHQSQNEAELDRLQRVIEKVDQNLDRHQDAHWRSGR